METLELTTICILIASQNVQLNQPPQFKQCTQLNLKHAFNLHISTQLSKSITILSN